MFLGNMHIHLGVCCCCCQKLDGELLGLQTTMISVVSAALVTNTFLERLGEFATAGLSWWLKVCVSGPI